LDLEIDDKNVLQPDLVFLTSDHPNYRSNLPRISAPPTLVIEVHSPSTKRRDLTIKPRLYAKYGIQHLWNVDCETQTVEVFDLVGGSFVSRLRISSPESISVGTPFEGLTINLRDLFR